MSTEEHEERLENVQEESESDRDEARRKAHARAWELARQQGVVPIRDIKELQGDFWPEDESIDDFLAWLRATRQEDKPRSIPE
jgi:hypothetical protein